MIHKNNNNKNNNNNNNNQGVFLELLVAAKNEYGHSRQFEGISCNAIEDLSNKLKLSSTSVHLTL